jgi:hypothetical protein
MVVAVAVAVLVQELSAGGWVGWSLPSNTSQWVFQVDRVKTVGLAVVLVVAVALEVALVAVVEVVVVAVVVAVSMKQLMSRHQHLPMGRRLVWSGGPVQGRFCGWVGGCGWIGMGALVGEW